MKKIVIIGGGASGILAAIFASKKGNDVIIIEKNIICGKKILATGNGRCNFWNEDQLNIHFRGSSKEMINNVLNEKNKQEIFEFFSNIGMVSKIKNGYYYPYSNQAISMQRALLSELKSKHVKIMSDSEVKNIIKKENQFIIMLSNGTEIISEKVIIATGSKAAPKTGSDGIGYSICKNFKHTIIKPLPALVQIRSNEKFLNEWDGARQDALVLLYENGKYVAKEEGEVQFTNYGISGICVFNLSGRIARGLDCGKKEFIKINFFNGLKLENKTQFIDWMNERNKKVKNRSIQELLECILNYKVLNVILDKCKIKSNEKWDSININKKNELAQNCVEFSLSITGTNSFDKAQVCSGGIPLDEINLETMESKKINNLYIVGELLDVDGDCGGYNLEWAWITGMLAGKGVNNDKIKAN